MPKLIDAEHFYKELFELYQGIGWDERDVHFSLADIKCDLELMPTVDAVEVVRCKDCKWCHAGYCEKADDIIPFGFPEHEWENFYCAFGERREDGKTH